MPLNPNGKIDKPALPFPDTVQIASVAPTIGTSTLSLMLDLWRSILPNAPSPIPTDESFFDLGGHSILATRLIFEIRKVFVVNAPLGLVFERPTVDGLVSAVDTLRSADLGLEGPEVVSESREAVKATRLGYGQDYAQLLSRLKQEYPPLPADFASRPSLTVFLTGATGFLGAFVLHNLLSKQTRVKKVICLVRAESPQQGLQRLREGNRDREVWNEEWVERGKVEVVVGDLGKEFFGVEKVVWDRIGDEADVIVHNGALVRFSLVCVYAELHERSRFIGYIHTRNCGLRT